MSDTPAWVLSIAYWLHMLATVTWLGGLSAMAFLMLPALRRSLNADNTSVFPNQLQNRLNRLGWISLVVLSATGMFQMSSHPQYQGFLAIENSHFHQACCHQPDGSGFCIFDLGSDASAQPLGPQTGSRKTSGC
jgi:putative copper export protein